MLCAVCCVLCAVCCMLYAVLRLHVCMFVTPYTDTDHETQPNSIQLNSTNENMYILHTYDELRAMSFML